MIASLIILILDVQRSLDICYVFQFCFHLIFQCVCYCAYVNVIMTAEVQECSC